METDSGIYCFENILNKKKYVGQAQNLRERLQRHNQFLSGDYDGCVALQNAWNLYGEEYFIIYTVEICDIDLLNDREKFWIKELHSHISEWGYNISWGGDSFMRGRHHTDESKRKISENSGTPSGELNWAYGKPVPQERRDRISNTLKIYYETHDAPGLGTHQSAESNLKRSESLKGKRLGEHHSEESKEKMSIAHINPSDETRQKMSDARKGKPSNRKGAHHSEESRQKMSNSRKGFVQSQETIQKRLVSITGVKNRKNASSQYVGVSWDKKSNKWYSYINHNKKRINLGRFDSEIEAALAYNTKALELYGENAKLNIIEIEEV